MTVGFYCLFQDLFERALSHCSRRFMNIPAKPPFWIDDQFANESPLFDSQLEGGTSSPETCERAPLFVRDVTEAI